MAPLVVDPEAMYAAGSAVSATGDALAANLAVLTAGFSAHTGVDRAGEVFGLSYQEKAESVLKAIAAAVNACRKTGARIQQGAANYSNVEAASTLGGGSGALTAPAPPAELAVPGPPGTWGPGQPPPPLWSLVQSLILESWPDGDVAGLRAAASHWRAFGAAANGAGATLTASKALFDGQHVPEGDHIDRALTEIGHSTAVIGQLCDALARTIDTFADKVDHAQRAIRDLLRRIESLGDLGHDVMLIIDGDAWDEIKQIVKDINAVLQHLGQEARACEQAIRFLMQAADREVSTCEKYARRGLVTFFGEDVGNAFATVADTWLNAQEGVLKGAVGMGLGLVDLSPHWIAADPQGAAATWTGLLKNAWKESMINAAVNPREFAEARLQELKGLVHAEDWSTARPGLGAGEVAFDAVTLFAPGLGEAGAAVDGAEAAARGAGEEADAAGGAAGRAGGEGAAGARGALTDITRAGGDVTKNLEGATADLPEIKPPASGSPVAVPPGKPLEPPVESASRPAHAAPGQPHAPGDRGAVPHEPSPGIGERPAPEPGPHESAPAGGPREPASAPVAASPAAAAPAAAAPVAAGERMASAMPRAVEHSPLPVSPARAPVEPAPAASHAAPPAPSASPSAPPSAAPSAAAPHFAPPSGHPSELPAPGGVGGPGDGPRPGGHPHEKPPHDGRPDGPDDGKPGDDRDGKSHGDDGDAHGHGHDGPPSGPPQDPVHSHEPSGDGWHRLEDEPLDPHYGEPLDQHWDFSDNPLDPRHIDDGVKKLIRDPEAPFGRDSQGNAFSEHEYAERFNKIGSQGQSWVNFPPNDGAVPHTKVAYTKADSYLRDYGSLVDRIGRTDGKYLAVMEDGHAASWEERALHVNSLRDPYNAYTLDHLPDGWTIQVSEAAPALGQPGGSIQVQILNSEGRVMTVDELTDPEIGVLR